MKSILEYRERSSYLSFPFFLVAAASSRDWRQTTTTTTSRTASREYSLPLITCHDHVTWQQWRLQVAIVQNCLYFIYLAIENKRIQLYELLSFLFNVNCPSTVREIIMFFKFYIEKLFRNPTKENFHTGGNVHDLEYMRKKKRTWYLTVLCAIVLRRITSKTITEIQLLYIFFLC